MRKKLFSLSVITFCAICLLFTGCSNKTTNVYEATNTDIRLTDHLFIEYLVEDTSSVLMDEETKFKQDVLLYYGIDLDECLSNPYESKVFEDYSNRLTKFFLEVYGIDISEEIQNIKTYSYIFPDADLLGFNIPGTYNVVLNQRIIDYNINDVKFTWCHEVIHALGLNYVYDTYDGLYETITEAVNYQFFEWNGNEKVDSSLYEKTAKTIGYQLITADPSIVSCSLTDDTYLVENRINDILGDATYPIENIPEETDIAFQLSSFLYSIYQSDYNYQYNSEIFDFTAQEISAAYCREFNLDEETLANHKKHWLVKNFDKVDVVHDGFEYLIK